MIHLIVNGDDFGLSEEVNESIVRAFREGVLTSCSLMVTGEAVEQAIRLAERNEGLAVGIHLVTVMGRSVLPHSEIPTIVDRNGNFASDPTIAGIKYFFSMRARRELRQELEAQFMKFQETGLRFSHIDSHLHMHVHPVIFDAAVTLGEAYGVKSMRVPQDELSIAVQYDGDMSLRRQIYAFIFWLLSRRMKKKLGQKNFAFTDRVYGNLMTGRMHEEYFLFTLSRLRNGSAEIYFHPALYRSGKKLCEEEYRQLIESDALISRKVIDCIEHLGIKLTNYSNLKALP